MMIHIAKGNSKRNRKEQKKEQKGTAKGTEQGTARQPRRQKEQQKEQKGTAKGTEKGTKGTEPKPKQKKETQARERERERNGVPVSPEGHMRPQSTCINISQEGLVAFGRNECTIPHINALHPGTWLHQTGPKNGE